MTKEVKKHAKVTMYTKLVCPYCVRAKQLLAHKGVSVDEIRVDLDQEKFKEMLFEFFLI